MHSLIATAITFATLNDTIDNTKTLIKTFSSWTYNNGDDDDDT